MHKYALKHPFRQNTRCVKHKSFAEKKDFFLIRLKKSKIELDMCLKVVHADNVYDWAHNSPKQKSYKRVWKDFRVCAKREAQKKKLFKILLGKN